MADSTRKHRLLFELGRGGMGTVYLAVAEGPAGFSKLKVIKQLNPRLASEPQFLKMFLDEARLSALLNHPNVVQTNEVGFDGRDYFIEMEYLEGQPYDAVVRRAAKGGGLPVPLQIWVLTQVLAGLHYAHELKSREGTPLGVVHRDVSPHNVFVTYDGTVKVLDFGIAKAMGGESQGQTSTGVVKGKATYMAPEHAMRRQVDRRADVFAVGVMLWEALEGRRFWEGLDDFEIFRRLEAGDYLDARTNSRSTSESLDGICARALAPDPEKRYATAADFQEALEQHLETSGSRVGARSAAKVVTELFADRRTAIEQEVQDQLRSATENPHVSVRLLGQSTAYQNTRTGETRPEGVQFSGEPTGAQAPAAGPALTPENGTREVSRTRSAIEKSVTATEPGGVRRMWRIAGIAGALALVALGGAAVRGFHGTPTQAPGSPAGAALSPHGVLADGAPACAHNADCSRSGEPAICRRPAGVCATLTTPYCRVVAEPGDVENDATIWVGSMFPIRGELAEINGKPYERGMLVAREDFVKMTRGIPPLDGIGPSRPLGIVACDDSEDPAAVAHHLVDDVGVPAVLGFSTSPETIELATTIFIPKGVLAFPVMDGSPLIARLPTLPGEPRLVWRPSAELYAMSRPLSALVPQVIEPGLRKSGALRPVDALRVALVRYDNLTSVSLGEDIVGSLRFNGKPAIENGRNFEEVILHTVDDPARNAVLVDRLAAFAPHIVLFTGADEFVRDLFIPLEARPSARARPRPIYVENGDIDGPVLREWLQHNPEARARFYGMYGPLRTPTNLRFTTRYDEGLAKPLSYTETPSPSFDAFYVLAYAIFAAGHEPVTGVNLAKAIERLLPPGDPVDVGAAHIYDVFGLLREGRRVDLAGAATNLNFDQRNGDVASDAVLYCMRPGNGSELESDELPEVFNATDGTWSGTFGCPQ